MAIPHHDDVEVAAGDDWGIPGLLRDVNGAPLDLTNVSFEWVLIGQNGTSTQTPGVVSKSEDLSSGKILLKVAKTDTINLDPGRYVDVLRATIGSLSITTWEGYILVAANGFGV
jgi:hypothetical protein